MTAEHLGFTVRAGVDQNGLWRSLFEPLHPGATFHSGDLTDPMVLQQLLRLGLFHGVLLSGIACQPDWVLGGRKGLADPHAQSLPNCGMAFAGSNFGLECTPEIFRDCQVQQILRQFTVAVATGFRMAQAILKLGNSWCTRRVVSPRDLQDMPVLDNTQVVRDLIPDFTP